MHILKILSTAYDNDDDDDDDDFSSSDFYLLSPVHLIFANFYCNLLFTSLRMCFPVNKNVFGVVSSTLKFAHEPQLHPLFLSSIPSCPQKLSVKKMKVFVG